MLFASIALQQNSSLFLLLNNLGFFSDNRLYSENFSEKAPVISDVGKSLIYFYFYYLWIHIFSKFKARGYCRYKISCLWICFHSCKIQSEKNIFIHIRLSWQLFKVIFVFSAFNLFTNQFIYIFTFENILVDLHLE